MFIIIKSLTNKDIQYEFDVNQSYQQFINSVVENTEMDLDKVKMMVCFESTVAPFRLTHVPSKLSTEELLKRSLGANIDTASTLYILIIDRSQQPWLGAQFKPSTPLARLKYLGLKDKIPEEFKFSSIDEINSWPYLRKFLFEKFILMLEDAKDNGQLFVTDKEIGKYLSDLRKERDRLAEKMTSINQRLTRNTDQSTEFEVGDSELAEDSDSENSSGHISASKPKSADIAFTGMTYTTIQAKIDIMWNLLDKAETQREKIGYLNLYDVYQVVKYALKDNFHVRNNNHYALDVVRSPDDILNTHLNHELRKGKLKVLGKFISPESARFLKKTGFFKHPHYTETAQHICALVKSIYHK